MRRRLIVAGLLAAGAALALAQAPDPEPAKPPAGAEKYSLVWRRNVFDPERTPRSPGRSGGGRAAAPAASEDRLRLAGTMVSDGAGSAAFVSEGSSRGVRVLRSGDEIMGLRIGRIGTQVIEAFEGETKLEWPVGKEILRAKGEGWRVPGKASPEEIMARLRRRRLQEAGE